MLGMAQSPLLLVLCKLAALTAATRLYQDLLKGRRYTSPASYVAAPSTRQPVLELSAVLCSCRRTDAPEGEARERSDLAIVPANGWRDGPERTSGHHVLSVQP